MLTFSNEFRCFPDQSLHCWTGWKMLKDFDWVTLPQRHPVTHWEAEIHGSPPISPGCWGHQADPQDFGRARAQHQDYLDTQRKWMEVVGKLWETAWHCSQKIDDMLKIVKVLSRSSRFFQVNVLFHKWRLLNGARSILWPAQGITRD